MLAGPAGAEDATGQAGDGGATSLENYLTQPDRLLVERSYPMPAIGLEGGVRLALEAIVAYEPGREQDRVLGVRVRALGAGGARPVYLDLHEVEDLARSIAALPNALEPERGRKTPVEIRFATRGGFGVAIATGSAPRRREVRFAGPPSLSFTVSQAALDELRAQLDACKRYLFEK